MESYVETTFIQSVLTILLSVLLAQYATLRPLHLGKTILYAFVISLISISLWGEGSILLPVGAELLFFLTAFKKAKKTWLFAYGYRWLLMLSCFVLWKGSFHNLLWFVPFGCPIVWVWLFFLLILFLLHRKWKLWAAKLSCIYSVSVQTDDGWKQMKGYLDSGNLLRQDGLPVVFLHRRWRSFFQHGRIYWIQMEGISQKGRIGAYRTQIQLSGCQKHEVYLCLEQELKLPMNAQVLLNMNLMTMG